MFLRRYGRWLGLVFVVCVIGPSRAKAQGPTIEESGILLKGMSLSTPGSMSSLLGTMPGSSGMTFGMQPGRDDMVLGKIGLGAPRVPTSIMNPGGVYQGPPTTTGFTAPQPLPVPPPLLYGTMERPTAEYEGPPDGLTLDQAIDLLIDQNFDLRAKSLEIPQARADVITAGLRANPIFYADSQLVPYGSDSVRKPDGPTQYDLNISHPLDISHKRQARKDLAVRSLDVMEAQYQNEVRLGIQNLYNAYVDVLLARNTIVYIQQAIKGTEEKLRVNQGLFEKSATSADVDQSRSEREIAVANLMDAEEVLRQRKRTLGELLNLPPEQAERLELRGSLRDHAPPPPELAELLKIAREFRPDLAAYRLGTLAAESNVRLQRANRFSDAYLLVQPFTFQNNAPYGKQSGASWAIGITMPLPIYNHNQGNIERARINVQQSQVQLSFLERRLATEVQQALAEYLVSARIERHIHDQVLPGLQRAKDAHFRLWNEGEIPKIVFLDSERKFNEASKTYLDAQARHRRSMLTLNTVVAQRVLP